VLDGTVVIGEEKWADARKPQVGHGEFAGAGDEVATPPASTRSP
jgi:hypothetical protein